jgi:2-phosphoglycerate kinase
VSYDQIWKILLIGGSSGTGKTGVCRQLADQFGVSVLLADDIRMAIQQVTTREQFPKLHYFYQENIWERPIDELVQGWIDAAAITSAALETIIAHHIVVDGVGRLIIEGDAILPSMAAKDWFAWSGPVQAGTVRSVFLHEPDESVLLENMQKRGRGFETLKAREQQNLTEAACKYGMWLKEQAGNHQLPLISCHPWDTLIERTRHALNL